MAVDRLDDLLLLGSVHADGPERLPGAAVRANGSNQVLQHLHSHALYNAILHDDVSHGTVFGVETHPAFFGFGVVALERRFVIHERNNDLAGFSVVSDYRRLFRGRHEEGR